MSNSLSENQVFETVGEDKSSREFIKEVTVPNVYF